jgi:hypothetical protein
MGWGACTRGRGGPRRAGSRAGSRAGGGQAGRRAYARLSIKLAPLPPSPPAPSGMLSTRLRNSGTTSGIAWVSVYAMVFFRLSEVAGASAFLLGLGVKGAREQDQGEEFGGEGSV